MDKNKLSDSEIDEINERKEIEYQLKLLNLKEKWKILKINGYETIYKISNHGRIKNIITKEFIKPYFYRYDSVGLRYKNKSKTFLLHRLVALTFIKIPDELKDLSLDKLVINHKDGIRNHNAVFNLEWTTSKGNAEHAFTNGLCNVSLGENSHLAKMSNKQAIQCCELLEKGLSVSEISEKVGVSKKSVQHIKSGESWTRLSNHYKFKRIGKTIPNTLKEEDIHEICKLLEEKKYSDPFIAMKFGISREYVRDIRKHKRRKNISSQYNF